MAQTTDVPVTREQLIQALTTELNAQSPDVDGADGPSNDAQPLDAQDTAGDIEAPAKGSSKAKAPAEPRRAQASQATKPRVVAKPAAPEQPVEPSLKDLRRLALRDPTKALAELGIDANFINEYIINGNKLPASAQQRVVKDEVMTEVEQLRHELNMTKAELKQQKLEETRNDFRAVVQRDILADPDRFEFLSMGISDDGIGFDPAAEIEELVTLDYQRQLDEGIDQPIIMSHIAAAEALEEFLFERAKKLSSAKKLKDGDSFKAKYVTDEDDEQEDEAPRPAARSKSKSVQGRLSAKDAQDVPFRKSKLSLEQIRRHAIAALQKELG